MQEGMALVCVMCRDGKGKSNGRVHLRRPYNEEKWDSHAVGRKHKINMALWNYWFEIENKGKQRMKKQRGMTDFQSIIKKRSYSCYEEGEETQWSVN